MNFFSRPTLGLSLGAGGGKGWAHIGVLKVFQREKIRIDAISGTSSGALIGAFYAAGKLPRLEEFLLKITSWKKALKLYDFTYSKSGFIKGEKLSKIIDDLLGDIDFKDLKIPFLLTAVDLFTGEEVVFDKINLKTGIRASISIPGIMKPVRYQDKLLIDGGILNPVPVNHLRSMGLEKIIAIDLSGLMIRKRRNRFQKNIKGFIPREGDLDDIEGLAYGSDGEALNGSPVAETSRGLEERQYKEKFGIYEIILRSLSIMQNRMLFQNIQKEKPSLIISPRLSYFKFMEIHKATEAIKEGERVAYERLKEIKKISRPLYKRLLQ